ncbi:MAG: hypothetical protein ABR958_00115 [Dehalococcoidales bacterium]
MNNNKKFSFKIRRKILVFCAVTALALTLWPVHLSKTDAAVLASVSPLAVTVRNLWGAPKGEAVDATLYRSDSALGWNWSRLNPLKQRGLTYVQPIYPSARIVLKTPAAVGAIQSFNLFAEYDYKQKPTGSYNLAFDVFLREKGTATDNRKSEIMVWLDWTLPQPASSYKGVVSDGSNTFDDYSWTKSNGFDYHSFLVKPKSSSTARAINLKALIERIKPDKDWYISEVELGTEVWNGAGAVELTSFYLELNGETL